MQHPIPPDTGQDRNTQWLARIDQLESRLRGRQLALRRQREALLGQLGRFGLDTAEKVTEACAQMEAAALRLGQPPLPFEPTQRVMARPRMGRMV